MIFNSLNYVLIFLPIVVSFYYLIKNNNYRNIFLIIASFYFYAWGNPLWALILMLSASIDFLLAQKIEKINIRLETGNLINANANSYDKFFFNKENYQKKLIRQKKFYLLISVIFNCLLLLVFKYWNWLMDVASDSSAINFIFLKHNLALPPAISFYTFESLSYIIDIYRNKYRSTKNFFDYLTFIAFFPKLVAGPIMRAHELIPQLITVLSDEKLKERPDLKRCSGVIAYWLNRYMNIFMRDLNYELNLTPIPGPYVSIVLMALDIPYEILNENERTATGLCFDYKQLIFHADANDKLSIVNVRLL
jgi:D-alanyl-lipoteichoic acid acyltransferase DltB (MBOAT superfamily)